MTSYTIYTIQYPGKEPRNIEIDNVFHDSDLEDEIRAYLNEIGVGYNPDTYVKVEIQAPVKGNAGREQKP